ncbi:MAG: cell division protein FtsK, partial [Pseudomonadales bacterium]|nr:cell division protein FtsK [Pseudomonadales bacterium]
VSDEEVHRVVADWKRRGEPVYIDAVTRSADDADMLSGGMAGEGDEESDALYDEAVRFVTESRKASISAVQRKLRIGYNRAARMIESMEAAGVVSEMNSNGSREVIAPPPPRD